MAGRKFRGMDDKPGWINRELADIRRQLRELRAAKTLNAAEIGSGGIVIKNGGITVKDGDVVTFTYGDFVSKVLGSLGAPDVTVRGLQATTQAGEVIFESFSDPDISLNGQFQVGIAGAENPPYFDVYAFNADIEAANALSMVGGVNASIKLSDALGVQMEPGPAGYTLAGVPTTPASPNLVLDASSLALSRSVSSRRYKTDIADAALDAEALLRLTPRRFRMKAEFAEHGDDAPEHVGFIAEEAAEVAPEFVISDEEGPEAFSYSTYVTGLQAIVRHQAEQIADLTARLERLEQAGPDEKG